MPRRVRNPAKDLEVEEDQVKYFVIYFSVFFIYRFISPNK